MSETSNHVFFLVRPTDSEMARARKMKLREKMSSVVLKDILIYLFFLLIVANLSYSEKDKHMFIYRRDLVNMFERSRYTGGIHFDAVRLSHSI